MTLAQKGGEKLEKGATVKALPPSAIQGLTPFFNKFKSGFDEILNDMKSIPESEQYKQLENQIDELGSTNENIWRSPPGQASKMSSSPSSNKKLKNLAGN